MWGGKIEHEQTITAAKYALDRTVQKGYRMEDMCSIVRSDVSEDVVMLACAQFDFKLPRIARYVGKS